MRLWQGEVPVSSLPVAAGESGSVLMVVTGEDGRATSVALFASDGADGHRVLVAPRDLTMQIPGYGEGTVGDAYAIPLAG